MECFQGHPGRRSMGSWRCAEALRQLIPRRFANLIDRSLRFRQSLLRHCCSHRTRRGSRSFVIDSKPADLGLDTPLPKPPRPGRAPDPIPAPTSGSGNPISASLKCGLCHGPFRAPANEGFLGQTNPNAPGPPHSPPQARNMVCGPRSKQGWGSLDTCTKGRR